MPLFQSLQWLQAASSFSRSYMPPQTIGEACTWKVRISRLMKTGEKDNTPPRRLRTSEDSSRTLPGHQHGAWVTRRSKFAAPRVPDSNSFKRLVDLSFFFVRGTSWRGSQSVLNSKHRFTVTHPSSLISGDGVDFPPIVDAGGLASWPQVVGSTKKP